MGFHLPINNAAWEHLRKSYVEHNVQIKARTDSLYSLDLNHTISAETYQKALSSMFATWKIRRNCPSAGKFGNFEDVS